LIIVAEWIILLYKSLLFTFLSSVILASIENNSFENLTLDRLNRFLGVAILENLDELRRFQNGLIEKESFQFLFRIRVHVYYNKKIGF